MATSDFGGQIDAWVKKTEARTEGVIKTATQSVIQDAQRPRAKGGRMPVDTGFLRNSGTAAVGHIPAGESRTGEPDPAPAISTLLGWKMDQPFFFGWVANYARSMEEKYAFMRLAAAKWQGFIDSATEEMKRRYR